MTMLDRRLCAAELKRTDPRRFSEEYSRWASEYWCESDADWVLEEFQRRYRSKGIDISELQYNIGFSQSDYACIVGRVVLADWMAAVRVTPDGPTYAEAYPALYLACDIDGSTAALSASRHGSLRVDYNEAWASTPACGVFVGLDDEDWDQLICEQELDAQLDTALRQYCESINKEVYRELVDAYEAQTSEEAFVEYCDSMELSFDVETKGGKHEVCC
jgi:hypothetical protein